ncbi:unnamed protein product, partial [Rotaria socialis]
AGESSRDNPTIINIADTNPDHNQILLVNDNQHRLSPHNFAITMNRHVLLKQDTRFHLLFYVLVQEKLQLIKLNKV